MKEAIVARVEELFAATKRSKGAMMKEAVDDVDDGNR